MSLHERQRSRSASTGLDSRSRRVGYDDASLLPRNNRSHKDGDGRRYRNRSHSPERKYRDSHSHSRRKGRSISPSSEPDDKSRKRERRSHRSRSPRESRDKHKHKRRCSRSRSRSRSPSSRSQPNLTTALQRSRGPLPPQKQAFTKDQQALNANTPPAAAEKQKPNFNLTGKLAAASNTVQTAGQTIVLKYHEPPESRKPAARDAWRMYVFKDEQIVDTVQLWEQSCWLFGRELAVADVPVEHPSCSGQHAVVQFRYVERRNEFGDRLGRVRPYVLDLESVQGTWLNEERIEEGRYFELRDGDVLKFGRSRREYVVQLPKSG